MLKHRLYIEDLEQVNSINIPWNQLEGTNVLITGGTGLICSVLVDSLIYRNEKYNSKISIWVLARNELILKERFKEYINKSYFHYVLQNVCNEIIIKEPIDFIIHGASKGDPYSFVQDPIGVMNANYLGTYQTLELARKKNTKKVLFISSGEVYGDYKLAYEDIISDGLKENQYGYIDILNPRSCYASSKRAAETLCASYSSQFGIKVNIIRPCHTYSATMLSTDKRVIGELIRLGLKHEDLILKSAGRQLRSYCYAVDTITALLYVLLCDSDLKAYNISNRNSIVTLKDLAELIAEKSGVGIKYEIPSKLEVSGDAKINYAVLNPTEIENLGWRPIFNLQDGINRIFEML